MRKLTDHDLTSIAGTTIQGYHVEGVRIKRGSFCDSDNYGIILGRNAENHYATWQFHLLDDDSVSAYWGHYFMENREAAIQDFHARDKDSTQKFNVTITETLKMTVEVEAEDQQQAEQSVSDSWKSSEYVLDTDNFVEVKFEAVPATK